jgi:hypothetical protein
MKVKNIQELHWLKKKRKYKKIFDSMVIYVIEIIVTLK